MSDLGATRDDVIVSVEHVTKRFGGIVALNDISFYLKRNEILGLIGPNGSGKTTAINTISGLYRADSGEVTLRDQPIAGLSPHKIASLGVGRTFQLLRLLKSLSVFDNVLHAAHLRGSHGIFAAVAGPIATATEEANLRDRTWEVLDFVGLRHRADVAAGLLTSGESRLLEVGRALAHDPEVLLLDEPASGLNTAERAVLERQLRRLPAMNKAVLLIEHDMRLVMALADRIVVLNEGRVLASGTPNDIRQDPRVIQAYLGSQTVQRVRRAHPHEVTANPSS